MEEDILSMYGGVTSARIADDTVGTGLDSAHARLDERAISWLMTHPSQLSVFPKRCER
jgi:hypothetical protein